jgi:hypothetical protein
MHSDGRSQAVANRPKAVDHDLKDPGRLNVLNDNTYPSRMLSFSEYVAYMLHFMVTATLRGSPKMFAPAGLLMLW